MHHASHHPCDCGKGGKGGGHPNREMEVRRIGATIHATLPAVMSARQVSAAEVEPDGLAGGWMHTGHESAGLSKHDADLDSVGYDRPLAVDVSGR